MPYSSPHDEAWFSDPDYDRSGHRITERPVRDEDYDYEEWRDTLMELRAIDMTRERMEDKMDVAQERLDRNADTARAC